MANVAHAVWAHGVEHPEWIAVRSPRGDLTFGDLRDASGRLGSAVRAADIRPLDRVVLIAPTVLEFPVVYYGLHALGVSVITMNVMATAPEIGYVLDDSEASLVLVWHEGSDAAALAAAERDIPVWIIEAGASYDAAPLTECHEHQPDDTAVILYTSGTTGRPKGVELTAANLTHATKAVAWAWSLESTDRFGTALPLFHVFGQSVVMNSVLAAGGSLSLLYPFEPVGMLEMMRTDRLTGLAGVPTMWNAMLQVAGSAGFTPGDFSSLTRAASGGASIPAEVIEAFKSQFGCEISEGWGMTETCGCFTTNNVNGVIEVGTVGKALPGFAFEIRDIEGHAVRPGVVGELYASGPTIMKGYRNRPEETESDLKEGWLKTGDLGVVDHNGLLSIVGRVKDLIIRGGYNVYPREVEEVFYEHPDIVELAVVGVPDERLGEEVAAVIVLREGAAVATEALREWGKAQLSAYKVPRLFQFVESLPKGSTGKILSRQIDRSALLAAVGRRNE